MENENFDKKLKRIDNILKNLTIGIVATLFIDIIIVIVLIKKNL